MYAKHRQVIERLYEDLATIKRFVEEETTWGETKISKELVPIYENQPCRISQKSLGANKQSEVQNTILYQTKLFIAPEVEIRQGDIVLITRQGITREYIAGEPFPYPTHQEVILLRVDQA